MRIAAFEQANDLPGLTGELDRVADLEPAELVGGAAPDEQFAAAGGEVPTLRDLHLRAQRQSLWADTANFDIAVGAGRFLRQIDDHDHFGGDQGPPIGPGEDARGLCDERRLFAGQPARQFGVRAAAQHNGFVDAPGGAERGLEAIAHREQRHQYADDTGDADHDHQRRGKPPRQGRQPHQGQRDDLAQGIHLRRGPGHRRF